MRIYNAYIIMHTIKKIYSLLFNIAMSKVTQKTETLMTNVVKRAKNTHYFSLNYSCKLS